MIGQARQSSGACLDESKKSMNTVNGLGALARLLSREPLASLDRLAGAHPAPVALVGGALRDAWLGRPPHDLDIVVESEFEVFLDAVRLALGREPAQIGDRFQDTRRFRWHGQQVDIGRALGTLRDDLTRRDFTVNAMALRLGGLAPRASVSPPWDKTEPGGQASAPGPAVDVDPELLATRLMDPFHGRDHLAARRLVCVTQGAFRDDPLRLLRGVRYASALPGFDLDPATRAAIAGNVARIASVADERVASEWELLLSGPRWADGVALASEFGLAELTLGGSVSGATDGLIEALEAREGDPDRAGLDAADSPDSPDPPRHVGRRQGRPPVWSDRAACMRLAALLHDLGVLAASQPQESTRANAVVAIEALCDQMARRRWSRRWLRQSSRRARWTLAINQVDQAGSENEDDDPRCAGGDLGEPVEKNDDLDRQLTEKALDDPAAALDAAVLAELAVPFSENRAATRLAELAAAARLPRWVDGRMLEHAGLTPGPKLGQLLRRAARRQVQGRFGDAEEAIAWAAAEVVRLQEACSASVGADVGEPGGTNP